jgi:hypothetical protein
MRCGRSGIRPQRDSRGPRLAAYQVKHNIALARESTMTVNEMALYTVNDGKISEQRFFYGG